MCLFLQSDEAQRFVATFPDCILLVASSGEAAILLRRPELKPRSAAVSRSAWRMPMTPEQKIKTRPSTDLPLASFRVWYHLPISLMHEPEFDGTDWRQQSDEIDFKRATYFHPHVAERLAGRSGLKQWSRGCKPVPFVAEYDKLDYRTKQPLRRHRIRGKVVAIELFVLEQSSMTQDNPGLAIAAVEVEFDRISVLEAKDGEWPRTGSETWSTVTLADAQNALEWVRHIFPRWFQEVAQADQRTPGNTLARVVGVGEAPSLQDMADAFERTQAARVMPWIEKLFEPIRLDNSMAEHFGDDRSYMVSAIELAVPDGSANDRAVLASVHPSDHYRLAECDTAGSGWPYSSAFLKSEASVAFYTRHAPHLERYENFRPVFSGNASLYIMAPHHLCGLGAGGYFGENEVDHIRTYYRPMQMICLIEYYRLLQFSQRLAALVRDAAGGSMDPEQRRRKRREFRDKLLQLRENMLSFTHVHHFSNVSSQIQAREMFERLYGVMGIATLHREVDEELKAAADFAAMQEAKEAAERAEELNRVVVLGVPASLLVGVAGVNLFVGPYAPDLGWAPGGAAGDALHWWLQAVHLSGAVAVVALVWGTILALVLRSRRSSAPWFGAGVVALGFWFFQSGAVDALRGLMGWPGP